MSDSDRPEVPEKLRIDSYLDDQPLRIADRRTINALADCVKWLMKVHEIDRDDIDHLAGKVLGEAGATCPDCGLPVKRGEDHRCDKPGDEKPWCGICKHQSKQWNEIPCLQCGGYHKYENFEPVKQQEHTCGECGGKGFVFSEDTRQMVRCTCDIGSKKPDKPEDGEVRLDPGNPCIERCKFYDDGDCKCSDPCKDFSAFQPKQQEHTCGECKQHQPLTDMCALRSGGPVPYYVRRTREACKDFAPKKPNPRLTREDLENRADCLSVPLQDAIAKAQPGEVIRVPDVTKLEPEYCCPCVHDTMKRLGWRICQFCDKELK